MKYRSVLCTAVCALLCAAAIFALAGCGGSQTTPAESTQTVRDTKSTQSANEDPISGGVIDRTDPDAPKYIESKEISDFHASFYLVGKDELGTKSRSCTFDVSLDENGILTASEKESGISHAADGTLLSTVQSVIDGYDLVQKNGYYRVTAGLAPECWECTMTVHYASGETLTFTENNDPWDSWTDQIYIVFATWFAENGDDTLLPAPITTETED